MKIHSLLYVVSLGLFPASLQAGAEYQTSIPESVTPVAKSIEAPRNNCRWYRLGEDDPREFHRRDVGLLFSPEETNTVATLGVQLFDAEKMAGGEVSGAAARLEVFELASVNDLEAVGEPIVQTEFHLPKEVAPPGGWLVIDFPKAEIAKGKHYLFLLSFLENRSGQWIDIATTRSIPQSSGVFRNMREGNPPVWTQSKGQVVFLLGKAR